MYKYKFLTNINCKDHNTDTRHDDVHWMCINYKNVEYVSNHSQATQDSKHYIDKPRKNKLGSLKLYSKYRFYEKVKRERNRDRIKAL